MDVGHTAVFDKRHTLESMLTHEDVVELNIRTKMSKVIDNLENIMQTVKNNEGRINSVHPPAPGNLSIEDYLEQAFGIADAVSANHVVLHTPKVHDQVDRMRRQQELLATVRKVEETHEARAAYETFRSRIRLLTTDDIINYGLPMVLDTSHMTADETEELVSTYAHSMPVVHLSQRQETGPRQATLHLPIDSFCIELVQYLDDNDWEGAIVLEYNSKDQQDKMIADTQYLKVMLKTRAATNIEDPRQRLEHLSGIGRDGYDISLAKGLALLQIGDSSATEQAVEELERAVQQNPYSPFGFYMYGLAQRAQARFSNDNQELIAASDDSFQRSLSLSTMYLPEIRNIQEL